MLIIIFLHPFIRMRGTLTMFSTALYELTHIYLLLRVVKSVC